MTVPDMRSTQKNKGVSHSVESYISCLSGLSLSGIQGRTSGGCSACRSFCWHLLPCKKPASSLRTWSLVIRRRVSTGLAFPFAGLVCKLQGSRSTRVSNCAHHLCANSQVSWKGGTGTPVWAQHCFPQQSLGKLLRECCWAAAIL